MKISNASLAFKRLNQTALNHLNDKYLTGYRYRKRDAVLDQVASIIDASGASRKQIAYAAGLSVSTIRAWTHGKTNRPQNATIEAFLHGMGYERRIVPINSSKE